MKIQLLFKNGHKEEFQVENENLARANIVYNKGLYFVYVGTILGTYEDLLRFTEVDAPLTVYKSPEEKE